MKQRTPLLLALTLSCVLLSASPLAVGAANGGAPRPPSRPIVIPTAPPEVPEVAVAPVAAPVVVPPAAESASNAATETATYVVRRGDTLSEIAQKFGVTAQAILRANNIDDADRIYVGQQLTIPGAAGGSSSSASAKATPEPSEPGHGSITDRLTFTSKISKPDSPFYKTTWVTYYGRPGVDVMGILGEYDIAGLLPRLRAQAAVYDEANGPGMGVMPAFHLIHGMATKASHGGTYLAYMDDEEIMEYINAAQQAEIGTILDTQIGGLTPLDSILPAFPYLEYDNVHLALDPEFAMSEEGQEIPGMPPGTITAGEINQVQAAMSNYMQHKGIKGRRMLIVHQFLPSMIQDKESIYRYDGVDLVICADGFGAPWPKISKYNLFMDETVQFTGFKLFYQWDEPIMDEPQTLGVEPYPRIGYMEVTPNLVVYQ